jgi:hypothetical protein
MAKITVTAGEGRTFPVHHTIAAAPGGTLLLLRRRGLSNSTRGDAANQIEVQLAAHEG